MKRTIVRRGQLCDVLWGMLEGPNIGATSVATALH